ncbi:hypothetical protein BCR44DRAFT_1429559 [Catenaria anguillulae PL171]|uniref:Uncharacterized protein n=1 Tax=Catenaria anguillulae PL171 TaxID=765915 RepID=A0A1Y2HU19_9FUNG|nr:hypothetical protein BCR44DRAFT_1429559 [Catenaria anguillulae PL171]
MPLRLSPSFIYVWCCCKFLSTSFVIGSMFCIPLPLFFCLIVFSCHSSVYTPTKALPLLFFFVIRH